MRDAVPFVDHFDDVEPSQLAGIERLAAGGGIKCRAIEIDALYDPDPRRPREPGIR